MLEYLFIDGNMDQAAAALLQEVDATAALYPRDEIWHLGDFASSLNTAQTILPKLNGRKHLVAWKSGRIGDRCAGLVSVQAYSELILDGIRLVLCHYPFQTW